MNYYLKRKNELLTIVDIDSDGTISNFSKLLKNPELAPFHDINDYNWLKKWWSQRSIPVNQDGIKQILQRKGFETPKEYLLQNLGLSLTDYYWMQPIDSDLKWEDVNLFDNDFHENLLMASSIQESDTIPHYTPNGSLQGTLEKSWTIINGKRCLMKGNRDNLSSESINECIASELHRLQNYHNYTPYSLIKINGRDYDYGCYSEIFTSQHTELISAYSIVISQKQPDDKSTYEHFIDICSLNGIDKDTLKADMEYQIMTDFILSGRDRHLSNISILRDSDSLQMIKMAPIYDSGKCLFVHDSIPQTSKELLNIHTESFASNELALLNYVQDRKTVDITKLPSRSYIEKMYSIDSQINDSRIKLIGEAYEKKIELFNRWQKGENLSKLKYSTPKTAFVKPVTPAFKPTGEIAKFLEADNNDLHMDEISDDFDFH